MKKKLAMLAATTFLLAAGALMWTGCDQTYGDDREMSVMPSMVNITNDKSWAITFYAGEFSTDPTWDYMTNSSALASSNLFYPLEWRVSNPQLGFILSSVGNSAVYQSYQGAVGANIVYCRDQAAREGQAVVGLSRPTEEEAVVPVE